MRGGPCVLIASSARQGSREPLVEPLDRNLEGGLERLGETLRLLRLLAPLAAKRERQSDDDTIDVLEPDEVGELADPLLARSTLDHAKRPSEGPGRVLDRDAGPRGAVVQRQHLH